MKTFIVPSQKTVCFDTNEWFILCGAIHRLCLPPASSCVCVRARNRVPPPGLMFDLEYRGDIFPEFSLNFHWTTGCYISEDKNRLVF
jgi:hypothetical protein